eukprot:TRINITY_DN4005_c0_g1_i13.p1 TRINITY_DN4005_c0_g1~~TRINITY_DN4005_c0_g1_i13.p1  ORF type:complete len:296 (+),score=130.51 TRINITY_DN4005_c0_g1_i13:584-1471(+)
MTESKEDIIMLVSFDNMFAVYPDTEEAKKEVDKYRNYLRFLTFNSTMTKVSGCKISDNMSTIEEDWTINFDGKDEFILGYKESKIEEKPRKEQVTVGGKVFKKYSLNYLVFVTYRYKEGKLMLYIVDTVTGTILSTTQLTDQVTRKVPLISIYDNIIAVGLPFESKKDEVMLLELFIAPEVAENSDLANVQRASLEKLVYPITTSVELKWKMYGMELMQVDGVDYVVTINDENELKMTDVEKLERGGNNRAEDKNTKEIDLPEEMRFVAPITIEYNDQARTILVHGMDIYSYELK